MIVNNPFRTGLFTGAGFDHLDEQFEFLSRNVSPERIEVQEKLQALMRVEPTQTEGLI